MVKKCAFPGCPNHEKPTRVRKSASMLQNERLTFFNLPFNDLERLKLWLLAIQRDVNLPLKVVKHMRLCREHFTPDDFKPVEKNSRRLLKSTAVPNFLIQNNNETKEPSQLSQYPDSPDPVFPTSFLPQTDLSENTVTEEIFSASYLNAVHQSTPVKQHRIHSSKQEPDYTLPSSLLLVLSSPATAVKSSKPSTSGTYYAFPAAKSYQFCEKTDAENDNLSEGLSLDVSMLSLNPPSEKKDTSFVPPSSTSTSTQTTEDDEENRLKDRKWIVNESSLMELFNRCHYCGASVIETQKTTCGSLIRVKWECCNGHHGKWDSCDDIRGMPANNLLVAACTLFTGATYVDIDDWATLLNLQLPKKTTFYAIQSSYLIPVIDVMYKEQQENILEGLRMQNIPQKGVHLSGDGRNDSPGFSAKYCTYSLMDDLTNQVVHYELVQVTEGSSSVDMEPVGFKRGVNSLLEMGMDIEEEEEEEETLLPSSVLHTRGICFGLKVLDKYTKHKQTYS